MDNIYGFDDGKSKHLVEPKIEDSGWIDCTIKSYNISGTNIKAFLPYDNEPIHRLQVRKIKNQVFLRGILTPVAPPEVCNGPDAYTYPADMVKLPNGFAPAVYGTFVMQGSMQSRFAIRVSSTGGIMFERYSSNGTQEKFPLGTSKIENGKQVVTQNGAWLPCNATWLTD